MKNWFIYDVDGKRVGVFVNSADKGYQLLIAEYGDEAWIDFVDIDWFSKGGYEKLHLGMSATDLVISTGIINKLANLLR